jgi:hypothetical protein
MNVRTLVASLVMLVVLSGTCAIKFAITGGVKLISPPT